LRLKEHAQVLRSVAVASVALVFSSCAQRDDQRIDELAKAFSSLSATAHVVCNAWMGGDASTAYTLTTLDQTFTLTEAQRSELMRSAKLRTNPRGVQLGRRADELERWLDALTSAVRRGDSAAIRPLLMARPTSPLASP
jgi:hypothetical protein